jgi:hypothetical protein
VSEPESSDATNTAAPTRGPRHPYPPCDEKLHVHALKVGAREACCGSRSFQGLKGEQRLDKVERPLGELAHVLLLQCFWFGHVGEFQAGEPGVCHEEVLVFWHERANNFLHNVELVHLAFARENGLAIRDFPHDAPNSPHVDTKVVVGGSEKELWGTVPARCHIIGELLRRLRHDARKTKIAQFELLRLGID